jgi:hypothetical protein
MNAPHKIPEEEYKDRVKKIIPILIARGRTKNSLETTELFQLYNDRMLPYENGT